MAAHSIKTGRTQPKRYAVHRRRRDAQTRITGRVVRSAIAVGIAGSLAGFGTYASFTASASESQSFTAGTVTLAYVGSAGSATNRLTIAASGIIPGDTIARAVDLQNTGSEALSAITLTVNATTSSLLDTDATNGLQMVIDRCSVAWTEAGTSPAFTYTCSGTTSSVLASHAVIGSNIALSNLTTTTAGNTDHLRFIVTFPSTATNTMQGVNSVIQYAFDGTARANSAH